MTRPALSPSSLLTALLVSCAAGSACRQDPAAAAAAFVASGDRYVQERRYKEAILEYRNALEHRPEVASTHAKLASAYDAVGDSSKAVAALVKVTDLDESNVEANVRVAEALAASRRFNDARQFAERVLRHHPHHVDALVILADSLAATGQPKAADDALAKAFAIDPHSRRAHLTKASWQIRDRRVADAKSTLTRLVELHPRAADAWIVLGTLEWQMGSAAAAERSLQRGLDLGSKAQKADAHRALAAYYVSVGKAPQAEAHLKVLAERGPQERLRLAEYYIASTRMGDAERELGVLIGTKAVGAVARLRRAQLRYSQRRNAEADQDLAFALKDPEVEPDARLLKSRVLVTEGKLDAALKEAQLVASAHPRRPDATYAVALIAIEKMDWARATEWLERTRALTNLPAALDVQLARVALAAGRPTDALRHARLAAQDLPAPATHALLARALRAGGDAKGAARSLAQSRRRWPQAATLDLESGYLELQENHPRAALKAFERAVRVAPDDPAAATILGMARQERGDSRGAGVAYERALARDPRNGIAANNLAWLYAESGRLSDALALAQRATELLNNAPQALDTLGWVHYLAGRCDDAIRAFQAAIEKQPGNPTYHQHLGTAFVRAGRSAQARESLERALRIAPSFEGAAAVRRMLADME